MDEVQQPQSESVSSPIMTAAEIDAMILKQKLTSDVLHEFEKLERQAVALVDRLGGSRELALVKTKIQEARLWLQEHVMKTLV